MATKLIFLLALVTPSISQTVSIFQQIPSTVDQCVRPCLFRPNNPNADVGNVLECVTPYRVDCYCATAKAKVVSEHIDSCAQASCSRGDETQDAETMRSYYASYCMKNGYTADAMEEWYTNTDVDATGPATGSATGAARDFWGWASTTKTRGELFSDKSATATAASDDSSASSASFSLPLLGLPLWVVLFQGLGRWPLR
ncbi:hypothetical protein FHETE_8458 [Fusarium heterosporum]|uniref:Extracellular membrane protein CFEM domain-containing protein n=1 Tax=Fusarium heterosporum TaxID=42747 RepID=A0A8H5WIM4_FUSHE|nr:hypothetical protein FHETE_8458 [Fusarium heterosporum]